MHSKPVAPTVPGITASLPGSSPESPSIPETWISVADAALTSPSPSTIVRRIEKGTICGRIPENLPFTYDGERNYHHKGDILMIYSNSTFDSLPSAFAPQDASSADPFDEPLEEQLVLDDTHFEAARRFVTVDGMGFFFIKPPYMGIEDQNKTKRKLKEAYVQHELLLLYGFSGSGKTTMLEQFAEKYPNFVHSAHGFFQSFSRRTDRLDGQMT